MKISTQQTRVMVTKKDQNIKNKSQAMLEDDILRKKQTWKYVHPYNQWSCKNMWDLG